MAEKFDVIVVGAGPGGYVAAIRAAQLGFKTACIERERPGGICLNWGCIPTKALLKSAAAMRTVQHANDYGIIVEGKIGFDWNAGKLEVTASTGKRTLESPRIIIATGARAKSIPGIEPDGDRVITYREAMVLPEAPKSMVVIGAGAIGCEFADFWNAFGVDVTIVEAMPRLVPIEDEEISETLARSFKKKGIKIETGAKVGGVKVEGKSVTTTITTASGEEKKITSDRVLVATGVRANIENIGLEGMGVQLDRGFIVVDDKYQTTSPGIYAIGDVAGPPLLAHVAMVEGIACVEWMAGKNNPGVNYDAIPGCTYCEPEVASVGLTEKAAREKGIDISVGKFPFAVSGKALGAGHTEGYVKVLVDKAHHGRIVGVHAIGHGVTDLIAEMSLAITSEAGAHDILAAVHPHPTLSEAIMEATAAALGEAVHT